MTAWYTSTKPGAIQGLVCDQDSGANIAVTYEPRHAGLVAAAPEMARLLGEAMYGETVCDRAWFRRVRDVFAEISEFERKFEET